MSNINVHDAPPGHRAAPLLGNGLCVCDGCVFHPGLGTCTKPLAGTHDGGYRWRCCPAGREDRQYVIFVKEEHAQ